MPRIEGKGPARRTEFRRGGGRVNQTSDSAPPRGQGSEEEEQEEGGPRGDGAQVPGPENRVGCQVQIFAVVFQECVSVLFL